MGSKSLFGIFALMGVVALASFAEAAVPHRADECPLRNVQTQFDLSRILGTWYEIEKIPTGVYSGRCFVTEFDATSNGTVGVRNAGVADGSGFFEFYGTGGPSGDPSEAKFEISFPMLGDSPAPYWILSTNYNQYAIIWSCRDETVGQHEFLWYVSRSRNPDAGERLGVRILMENLDLDVSQLVETDQSDCVL